MDSKNELFEVEFTDKCIEDMEEIYEYIANNLKENNSAKRLMTEVMDKVLNLKNTPELYMKIGKKDKLKREYYRMVVKNYIILYTVDFDNKKVYISQMIYGKRNYLKQKRITGGSKMYDVIVIGSGPAGITAAIYSKRRNLSILVISKGNGTLQKAEKIDNYYGFENGISGKELYVNGIKQAKNLGIDFIEDEVINIEYINQFTIETVNSKYEAKAVILATGVSRNVPNIKGIKEFEGKGVSYCAVCDSFFYKGKDVAVLGDGNYAIHEFETLKPIASSVTILTNGNTMVENRDSSIEVNSKKIREFRGDTKLEKVEFEDNTIQNLNGVFIAMGTASSSDLARKIGARIENNNIVVNENMETTVPGLFACGDCTGGLLQISKAVYEGAKAGLAVLK